ncbi:MAG: OsmC family protein [Flavobacteriaceae bacterium]|jgi:uncharacterized OsmC-like protein|nr:OsmC family protein [Pelagibacteraceae bacterium]MBT5856884.1 OsmC family protein [Flavobacteriaceae bacterium]MBT3901645.1 OsmC family protein [Pelagibacteraceae bacterium]MBT4950508.1 OsmC family protein [Pelagibacteraceae bacterium]MBT5213591.1 OsmC family protein [Pelagibacteraceae bacterium]
MTGSCSTLNLLAYNDTKEAIKKDPSKGKGEFKTVTIWKDGALAETTARSFTIKTDEPTPLGGGDTAIDPMELLLGALGSCLTIGWITQANLKRIKYKNLKIEVTAPFDLQGYLALDKNVRPGFSELKYQVQVETDAEKEILEEIRKASEKLSPMFDNILNKTKIEGEIIYV